MIFKKDIEFIVNSHNAPVKCALFYNRTEQITLLLGYTKEEYDQFIEACHERFRKGDYTDITLWHFNGAYTTLETNDSGFLDLQYHETPPIPKQLYPKK